MFKSTLIALVVFSVCSASDTLITVVKHDTVFIDRLVIDNPIVVQKLLAPEDIKISPFKKITGWTMIAGGVYMGALSVFNMTEGGKIGTDGGYERKLLRDGGFYGITFCLSIVPIVSGINLLIK
jgi:hypothetical protein